VTHRAEVLGRLVFLRVLPELARVPILSLSPEQLLGRQLLAVLFCLLEVQAAPLF
jgi:hypothetical protein